MRHLKNKVSIFLRTNGIFQSWRDCKKYVFCFFFLSLWNGGGPFKLLKNVSDTERGFAPHLCVFLPYFWLRNMSSFLSRTWRSFQNAGGKFSQADPTERSIPGPASPGQCRWTVPLLQVLETYGHTQVSPPLPPCRVLLQSTWLLSRWPLPFFL